MPQDSLTPKSVPRTYAELRRGVEKTLLTGQRRIEEAKVRTYWETGRLIHEHLLLHKDRADYGAQLIPRLGRDLNLSDTVLYRCLRFARAFPILAARPELSWAHYRALIYVEDKSQRRMIETQAAKNGWTSRELENRIRPINLLNANNNEDAVERVPTVTKPLAPKRGTVGIYKLVSGAETLSVDLGFTSFLDLTEEQAERCQGDLPTGCRQHVGDFVRLDAKGKFLPADDAKTSDLYTYRAEVLRVVDGDTLWMKIYLRPRHWLKEKLRLRALDCPEMDTPEGKAAKRFVETLVAQSASITITTTKPDKYDRYLSDVFLETAEGEEVFLNNALLENGHAIRKKSYSLSDWEQPGEASPPVG